MLGALPIVYAEEKRKLWDPTRLSSWRRALMVAAAMLLAITGLAVMQAAGRRRRRLPGHLRQTVGQRQRFRRQHHDQQPR